MNTVLKPCIIKDLYLLSNIQAVKNFLLFLIMLLCLTVNLYAQHHKIDSLKNALAYAQKDTEKINTLIRLGKEMEGIKADSSVLLGKQALALSRSTSWGKGIVYSQYSLGNYYRTLGDIKTALEYADTALANSRKYKYAGNLASIYNQFGNLKSDQNNYSESLDYYFKALAIDSLEDKQMLAGLLYDNIGSDYQEIGQYIKAEEYYLRSEKIFEEKNDKEGLANSYGNLGTLYYLQGNYQKGLESNFKALELDSSLNEEGKLIPDYANIGLGYSYLKNHASTLAYNFKALSLIKKTGKLYSIQVIFSSIGGEFLDIYESDSAAKGFIYRRDGVTLRVMHSALLDSAFAYVQKCITYANMANDRASLMTATNNIGDIYAFRKDYTNAISYYQRSYDIADSLGVLYQKMEGSEVLGHTYAKLGNYKMAVKYLDNVIILKDTLFGQEKNKQMAEMEAKYQNEKKQKEIETLAQKNEIQNLQIKQSTYFIFGLASLVLLIATMAFLLIRQNRINTLNTKIELEQKLLRSQMNPHFIFNVITSIQNYIYKEEPQEAANYLSSVFKLMRSIIESSKKEYVFLDKEISALKDYLALQQLCFQNKFDFKIDMDPNMDTENIMIPPMMAQPFIENAIEHGIINNPDKNGEIIIRLLLQHESFSLEIEDNGVGREKAKEINLMHTTGKHLSVATNITRERIALLNKKLKKKISMNIVDLKNPENKACGTKVIFFFPLNLLS